MKVNAPFVGVIMTFCFTKAITRGITQPSGFMRLASKTVLVHELE
jgi:hypothetical protein